MNYWGLIGRFFPKYKGSIILNILFMAFSALFSIVSFSAVIPIINMIFGVSDSTIELLKEPAGASIQDFTDFIKNNTLYYLQNSITEHGIGYGLLLLALFIIITAFFSNAFSYLAEFFRIPMRVGILKDLRKELYDCTLAFPAGLLSKDNRGDLVSRMTNDVLEVEWCVNNTLDLLIEHPIPILIYLITLFSISPKLAIIALLLLLLCSLIVIIVGRSLKRIAHKGQSERGTILSLYEETIGGLNVIRSFNAEKQATNRFEIYNENNRKTFQLLNRLLALATPVTRFTISVVLAFLLWYGGNLITTNGISLGVAEFVYFLLIFYSTINPLRGLAKASYSIRKQIASLERINKVLNMKKTEQSESLDDIDSMSESDKSIPAICFSHVSFSYDHDHTILKNVSFALEQGKSLAILGAIGIGKTTLAQLAIKLITPDSGTIKVYGNDITRISTTTLRNTIGYVPQEAILFNDSIFNNIALGVDKPQKQDVIEAAIKAGIHYFITTLPDGYDTIVGDRGSRLSGGQKQQIALARIFLKKSPIVILDEPTASLDSDSVNELMVVIADFIKTRSTILITHDERVAKIADSTIKIS